MSLFTAIQGIAKPAGAGGGSATLYAETSDGYILSSDDELTDYSIARNGTGLLTEQTATTLLVLGQNFVGAAEYRVWEAFLNFDVSGIGGAALTAELSLWVAGNSSTTDFDIQIRTDDWGDDLTTADWVAGGDLSGKTLLAKITTAGIGTGAYLLIPEEGSALRGAIDDAVAGDGVLRLVICSSRTTNNDAPTGPEFIQVSSSDETGTAQDPKLVVTW